MATTPVYVPEYRDRIGQALKVMQLIQSGYGIKTDYEINKIREEQGKQEKLKTDEMERLQKRRLTNTFNQEEADALMPAQAGDPGSTVGWIKRGQINEDGEPVTDDNGEQYVKSEPFFYFPKGYVEGKEAKNKMTDAEIELKEKIAAQHGLFTARSLMDEKRIYDYDLQPRKGYRQGKAIIGKNEVPVWYLTTTDIQAKNMQDDNSRAGEQLKISQEAAKRQKDQWDINKQILENKLKQDEIKNEELNRSADNKAILSDIGSSNNATGLIPSKPANVPLVLAPEFLPENQKSPLLPNQSKDGRRITADEALGYQNAIDNGIQNPTAADIVNYNPKKIEMDRNKISTKTQGNMIPDTVALLTEIDNLIGGINGTGKIDGIGAEYAGANAPVIGGLIGRATLTQNQRDIRGTVGRLRDILIKKQAGGNVTANEWERASQSLAAGAFVTPDDLRRALKTTAQLQKRELSAIESGFSAPSIKAFRENTESIHSQLPVFRKLDTKPMTPFKPMTDKEAMDDYFEGKD
jgi:hypothetical protein